MSLFGPPNIKKLTAQKNFDALVRAIEHRNPEIGSEAIQALGEIGNIRAVEVLASVLKNKKDFHEAALRSLVKIGISSSSTLLSSLKNLDYDKEILSQVIPELVKTINIEEAEEQLLIEAMHYGGWAQKWRAAEILGRRRCDEAICFLKASLVDEAWQVRLQAAKVLGEIGDQGAIEPLTDRLHDENRSVRIASLESLIQLNAINDPIIDMLLASRSWDELARIGAPVLGILLNALEKLELNDSDAYELARAITKLGKKGIEALIDYVKEKSGQGPDRSFICEALVHSGEEARKALIELIRSEPNASRNASIIKGLGQLLGDEEIEALIETTKSLEDKNRAAAVSALGQLRDSRVVDIIRPLLQDKSCEVRKEASQALKIFDVEELMKSYESLSKNPDEETIGKIPADSDFEEILRELSSQDYEIRSKAVEALGMLKDERAIAPLVSLLFGPDVVDRFPAELSDLRSRAEKMVAMLSETHSAVLFRQMIARALASIGGQAADTVIKALENENPKVRRKAADALEEISEVRAIEPLIGALLDSDMGVRESAAAALKRITGKDFAVSHRWWIKWWEENKGKYSLTR